MEQKVYEVALACRQVVHYRVEAADREEAERQVLDMWKRGDEAARVGDESCQVDSIESLEVPDEASIAADCEIALRFLLTREEMIEQLDGDVFNPTMHDAVSASEVAMHLGWLRTSADEVTTAPDVPRASRALERLCRDRRVVCFSRDRVRYGEKGEIRLYCTPQHLERLSAAIEE